MKSKNLFIILVSIIVSLTALSPNVVRAESEDGVYINVTGGEPVTEEYEKN